MLTADVVDTRTTAFMSCFLRPPMALKRNSHLNPGVRVEGILRQSADVDDVDQRVKEYEQGACSSESPRSFLWHFFSS
jgi:hypothetical protein